jgi:uncharacterized protein (DUF58 family)
MTAIPPDDVPFVTLADITEIELIILKRMSEVTMGDHRSRSHGSGFDFVGIRDWQAGDKFSSIDWAQSSLTNFAPIVVREFEQPSTATVVAIADVSRSTECGAAGTRVAAAVARSVATVGLSAVFFQDPFGIVTFDRGFENLGVIRPRTGKSHVVHCLEAYQRGKGLDPIKHAGSLGPTLAGFLRRTSMVPFVSDFLFADPPAVLRELEYLNATHDAFVVLIDSAFAFELPAVSAGWIEVLDVETGRSRTVSRRVLKRLAEKVRDWQDEVRRAAKDLDIDVVDVGPDSNKADVALSEFVGERRLRKMKT